MLNKTPYRESFYTSDDNTISRPFNFADGDNLRNILKAKTTLALMRGKRTHTLNFCRKMDLKSYVVKYVRSNSINVMHQREICKSILSKKAKV